MRKQNFKQAFILRYYIYLIISIGMSMLPAAMTAQESLDSKKASLEHRIATKYRIIESGGKYGVYDTEIQQHVTEVDMDYLEYSHSAQPEEDMSFCYYYFERGLMYGKIGINMNDNSTMEIAKENPMYVASLDACTTIDSSMQEKCGDALQSCLQELDGSYGQIAVLDASSAHLLAWTAMQKDSTGFNKAPLLRKFCSNRILKPVTILNCAGLEDCNEVEAFEFEKGEPCSNAMEWASLFNYFYHAHHLMIPLMDGDSVYTNTKFVYPDSVLMKFRENTLRNAGLKDVAYMSLTDTKSYAGVYDQLLTSNGQTESSFVGCVPAIQPKYCICMIIYKDEADVIQKSSMEMFVKLLMKQL